MLRLIASRHDDDDDDDPLHFFAPIFCPYDFHFAVITPIFVVITPIFAAPPDCRLGCPPPRYATGVV